MKNEVKIYYGEQWSPHYLTNGSFIYLSSLNVGNESYKSVSTDLRTCECWLNLRRRICQNLSWYTLILFPSSQWSCIYLHQSTIWAHVLGTEFDFQGSGIQSVSVLLLILCWRNSNNSLSSLQGPLSVFSLMFSFPLTFQWLLFWYARLFSPPSSSDRRLVVRGAPHKITMQIGTQHAAPH